MNKIVREHYPVERLPEDLKQELGLAQTVTLVIEPDAQTARQQARAAAIDDLLKHRATLEPRPSDAVERVRTLRDEWDR